MSIRLATVVVIIIIIEMTCFIVNSTSREQRGNEDYHNVTEMGNLLMTLR